MGVSRRYLDRGEQALPSTGSATGQPLVVGRERERERLLGLLDRAFGGHGSLTLISGGAGVGKTTLVEIVADAAIVRGALVLTGHCYDLTTTPPYGPWIEIIRASPRVEEIPSLSRITGASDDPEDAMRGDELFSWGIRLFQTLADCQPLIVILEDLHWTDRATLDFLRVIGRQLAAMPAMLVVTYRGDELGPEHPLYQMVPTIVRESSPERIDLRPLDRQATRSWLQHHYGLSRDDEASLLEYLQQHAEGNPFFTGEILRDLIDRDILHPTSDGWRLGNLAGAGLPVLLRQVLDARLRRVPGDTRQSLGLAAVIGQDVEIDVWQQLAGLSDTAILDTVTSATDAALVASSADGQRLSFRHALIREALYADILPLRRREIHRQIADILIDQPGADPDAIAYHLKQAGDNRAAEWLTRAGDRAHYTAYSMRIAIARYQEALDLLGENDTEQRGWLLAQLSLAARYADPTRGLHYAVEAQRIAVVLEDNALEAVAALAEGINLVYSGQIGHDRLERGYDLIDALSDEDANRLRSRRQGRFLESQQGRLQMAFWQATTGFYKDALATSERAFSLLDPAATGSTLHAASLHWGAGITWAALGDPARAAQSFTQSRDAFRAVGRHFYVGTLIGYTMIFSALPYRTDDLALRQEIEDELHVFIADDLARVTNDPPDACLAPFYLLDGRWDELSRIGLETDRHSQSVFAYYFAFPVLAEFWRRVGDGEATRASLRIAFPNGWATPPEKMRFWFAQSLDLQRTAADLALDDGNLDDARGWIDRRRHWLDWSERVLGQAENALLEARYHRVAGDPQAALSHATEALRLAEQPRQPLALIAAHRELGTLLTGTGAFDAAAEHLTASVTLAERCRAPYERAMSLIEVGSLHIQRGDVDVARDVLVEAEAIVAPLGALPALSQIRQLHQQIEPTGAQESRYGLSERELDVLRLVAQGLTDRQIGDQLFISRRTVSTHLTSILNKLGVNSRTAAALAAVEHHLLD